MNSWLIFGGLGACNAAIAMYAPPRAAFYILLATCIALAFLGPALGGVSWRDGLSIGSLTGYLAGIQEARLKELNAK